MAKTTETKPEEGKTAKKIPEREKNPPKGKIGFGKFLLYKADLNDYVKTLVELEHKMKQMTYEDWEKTVEATLKRPLKRK